MSEMRNYASLRFKFKEGISKQELYEKLKVVFGEPEWDETDANGGIIAFGFDTPKYKVLHTDDDVYCLDAVLVDSYDDGEFNFNIGLGYIFEIKKAVVGEFRDIIDEGFCQVVALQWYTGCDMPVTIGGTAEW